MRNWCLILLVVFWRVTWLAEAPMPRPMIMNMIKQEKSFDSYKEARQFALRARANKTNFEVHLYRVEERAF